MTTARTLTALVAFVAATLVAAGDASPCVEGPEHLRDNTTSAPRYVFVSLGGIGLRDYMQRATKAQPDVCAAFRETIECHIWAVDMANSATTAAKVSHRDAAVMMLGNAVTALSAALGDDGADLSFVGWKFVGENEPRWSDHGSAIVLTFTMPVPVPRGIRAVTLGVPTGDVNPASVLIPSVTTTAAMQTSGNEIPTPVYYEVEP